MTLQEAKESTQAMLKPAEAASILGCDPHWLRLMARERPQQLGFPVVCPTPHRVLIPRKPFLRHLGEE